MQDAKFCYVLLNSITLLPWFNACFVCYNRNILTVNYLNRFSVDVALMKYVEVAFHGGECSVYCTKGKDVEKSGGEFELTIIICNSSYSPKNFRYACRIFTSVLVEVHSGELSCLMEITVLLSNRASSRKRGFLTSAVSFYV